jgi:F0F1-type ATP synthase epsilon subunit
MFPPLRLLVITIEGVLLDVAGIHWVKAELADGMGIGIWPGHVPLLAETVSASLRYADSRGEHSMALGEGILHVENGKVTVYTVPTSFLEATDVPAGDDGSSR